MSQHIGVIFCAYGTEDYLEQSLAPWIELRAQHLLYPKPGRPIVTICAVNVRFAGFEGEDDGTREALCGYLARGKIDHLIDGPDNIPETQARGMALQYLRDEAKVDLIVQWDSDEMSTVDELTDVFDYVRANPLYAWFRLSYRNLVFTPNQWLAEPFTPPRIHRVHAAGYKLHSFSGDNDIAYGGTITRDIIPQERLASTVIPVGVANPAHWSWLNNERSRQKVAYQERRWGHCSFAWDSAQGGLIFNPALPRPKVLRESDYTESKGSR